MDDSEKRTLIASALVYAGGTHTVDDVLALIASHQVQLWEGPHSIVVTELSEFPQKSTLSFFLAAGIGSELEAMEAEIVKWGQAHGCTLARFFGRAGWTRSFMARSGWKDTRMVIMEKAI